MAVPSNIVFVQGQGTVSADHLNTYAQVCTNVATLRGFVGAANMIVVIQGTSSANDGGQGFFYYNPSGTSADDNGVTTVVPTGQFPGVWTRLNV